MRMTGALLRHTVRELYASGGGARQEHEGYSIPSQLSSISPSI